MGVDAELYDLGSKKRIFLSRWHYYANAFSSFSDDYYGGSPLLMTKSDIIERSYQMEDKDCAKALRDEVNSTGNGPFVIVSENSHLCDVLADLVTDASIAYESVVPDVLRFARSVNIDTISKKMKSELYTIAGAFNAIVKSVQVPEPQDIIRMEALELKYGFERKEREDE